MPILSNATHNSIYVQQPNYEERLGEIKKVIVSLVQLDIAYRLKKDMVKHAIWEITKARGDFKGRYRSYAALIPGVPIQRDHVWQKDSVIERLMKESENLDLLLEEIIHCTVTKEEHSKLTHFSQINVGIDGWDRYKGCGICVMDMQTGEELVISGES